MSRDNKDLVVGLDIGTSKIVAIVAEVTDEGTINIVGMGDTPSRGLRKGMVVNIAVGYGGRHEITDAVRALLRDRAEQGLTLNEVANVLTVDDIAENLYTAGQPDPDLVIRTSGEQRLSGFLLWQSVHSEYYFCDAYWPDFRRVDFLRALRSYGQRERRMGR